MYIYIYTCSEGSNIILFNMETELFVKVCVKQYLNPHKFNTDVNKTYIFLGWWRCL